MPLVRLFAHKALTKAIPLPKLQARLCEIWGAKPQTTKLLLTRVDDWTSDQFDEDVYVSVRAKATPERTYKLFAVIVHDLPESTFAPAAHWLSPPNDAAPSTTAGISHWAPV